MTQRKHNSLGPQTPEPDTPDASGTTPQQRTRHHTALRIAGIEGVEVFADLLQDDQAADSTAAQQVTTPVAPHNH